MKRLYPVERCSFFFSSPVSSNDRMSYVSQFNRLMDEALCMEEKGSMYRREKICIYPVNLFYTTILVYRGVPFCALRGFYNPTF